MAAFPSPFGAGLAYGALVPSGGGAGLGLNGINDNLPKAPNFVDGDATYNPLVAVTVGGAGIYISGSGWRVLSLAQINNYGASVVGQSGNPGMAFVGATGQAGLTAQGGGTNGTGLTGTGGATNGNGVLGTGAGTGSGVVGVGGATGWGGDFTGGGGAPAVRVHTGHAIFTGTQPAATADPGNNNIQCGTNVCKAWAVVVVVGGAASVLDGYNIASAAVNANGVQLTFARAMANANYAAAVSDNGIGTLPTAVPRVYSRSTTVLEVAFKAYGAVVLDGDLPPGSNDVAFAVHVMGRQ